MKVLTNEKTIKRNAKIGKYTMWAGFALFAASLYVNFTGLSDPKNIQQWQIWVIYVGMVGGFIVLQISTALNQRFGRSPRQDERLIAALKGLTKDYTLYNFLAPVNHLLVGPAGVWIIELYHQRGKIVYEKGKWKQKGGGFVQGYLKIFGMEGLGRPDLEIKADVDNLTKAMKKALGENIPPINVALAFVDEKVEIEAPDAPYPTLKVDQLKEHLRKHAKQTPFPALEMKRILSALPEESVE